jgi:hypothetical protein
MENALPWLILIGNCCIFPLLMFALGYAWAGGYLRSPIAIRRDHRDTGPVDPFE